MTDTRLTRHAMNAGYLPPRAFGVADREPFDFG